MNYYRISEAVRIIPVSISEIKSILIVDKKFISYSTTFKHLFYNFFHKVTIQVVVAHQK